MREKLHSHTREIALDTYSNELTTVKYVRWSEGDTLVDYSLLEFDGISITIRKEINSPAQIMAMELLGAKTPQHNRIIGNFLNMELSN